jgi:tRNA threonylcarbamoyladenosine modification (KEOPS) complex Cgi121 subunit
MKFELGSMAVGADDEGTMKFKNLPAVYVHQYNNVQNATELLTSLVDVTCLDAQRILSLEHLKAAIRKAFMAQEQNRMKTRSIYSEILHSLSPDNNVSQSFRSFGISKTTTSVLCVVLNDSVALTIDGDECDIALQPDTLELCKIFKTQLEHLPSAAFGAMAVQGL